MSSTTSISGLWEKPTSLLVVDTIVEKDIDVQNGLARRSTFLPDLGHESWLGDAKPYRHSIESSELSGVARNPS